MKLKPELGAEPPRLARRFGPGVRGGVRPPDLLPTVARGPSPRGRTVCPLVPSDPRHHVPWFGRTGELWQWRSFWEGEKVPFPDILGIGGKVTDWR